MPRTDSDGRSKANSEHSGRVPSESAKHPARSQRPAQAPNRPAKLPKQPMVRVGPQWYRARLLKYTSTKLLIAIAGLEDQQAPIWLPSDSDRIWRGSYKGKDWKHLGDGAWEPKPDQTKKRAASGPAAATNMLSTVSGSSKANKDRPVNDLGEGEDALNKADSSVSSGLDAMGSLGGSMREPSPTHVSQRSDDFLASPRHPGGKSVQPGLLASSGSAGANSSHSTAATESRGAELDTSTPRVHAVTGEHSSRRIDLSSKLQADMAEDGSPAADATTEQAADRTEAMHADRACSLGGTESVQPAMVEHAASAPDVRHAVVEDLHIGNAMTALPQKEAAATTGDEARSSPSRSLLQCREALTADDKEHSTLAPQASFGSQPSPRSSIPTANKQAKNNKRKRSSAPQRADPADLFPSDIAPSPRHAPPLTAFSTAWRQASSSPEPEPLPEMAPAGSPSPRMPSAKRPARKVRAPAKIAISPGGQMDVDAEHERPDKPTAGLLGMMERNESDDDPSEDAIPDAEPVQRPKRGGGRWGRGRGGRGRGRSASRQAPATPEPGLADGSDMALPPPARTRAGRGGSKRNGKRGGQKQAAKDDIALAGMPYAPALSDAHPGAVQPFAKLMQALEGLDEGQGMLLNGQVRERVSSLFSGHSSPAHSHEGLLSHMLQAQKGFSHILEAHSELFRGCNGTHQMQHTPPPVPLFQ